jgi:predicted RNase H-like HicB family nuclease
MKLVVIIEKDETGFYVAEVQAFPGCFSQGTTFEEAEANIREAIELWLEVMHDKNKDASFKSNNFSKKIALEV